MTPPGAGTWTCWWKCPARPVESPAWLVARIAGRVSRALDDRKVDVVLTAPNLKHLPVHDVAKREGVRL